MIPGGPRDLKAQVQDAGLCIGCGSCVELCPYFRSHQGRTVRLHDCDLAQGRCHAWCPKVELDLEGLAQALWGGAYAPQGVGPRLALSSARATAALGRASFQGGGAASALVTTALEAGLAQAAVLTGRSGLEPEPRLARDRAEVLACAGTGYAAAPTLAGLNRAQAAGLARLAVVATPCQAAALAQRRLWPGPEPEASGPAELVVGLFCNWSLDPRRLGEFLAQRLDPAGIRSMQIPPPPAGVLEITTDEGRLSIPLDEVRELIPAACAICPDMTAEWADVSVGMHEGRPGWNTLIVRTPRGQDLLAAALERGLIELEEMPPDQAAHLAGAAEAKRERGLGRALEQGRLGAPGDDAPRAIRVGRGLYDAVAKGGAA